MAQSEPIDYGFDGLTALTEAANPIYAALDKGQEHAGRFRLAARFLIDQAVALLLVTIVGICVVYSKLPAGAKHPHLDGRDT